MRRGPMSEDPQFQTVSAPDDFAWTTDAAVRYVPVVKAGNLLGYLWAAVTDDAAGFVVREAQGSDAFNASAAWIERLRWAKSRGMTPLQALRHWAGAPADERAGTVTPGTEREAPDLTDLRRLASAGGPAPMAGPARQALERYRSRVDGCFLGGALGDALGAPIEFDSLTEIRARHGNSGITGLLPYRGQPGLVTDDTQMTLFTAEGLITAALADAASPEDITRHVYRSYLRWLDTQRSDRPSRPAPSWLAGQEWLYDRRAPGNACLSGLSSGRMGTPASPANPGSKGCGAVMRSAPFGLQPGKKSSEIFSEAVASAVLTHGHPSGYLAAGAFAVIVRALAEGASLTDGVADALMFLRPWPGHEETTAALTAAQDAAAAGPPAPGIVERLGAGWVAEEALAIGVYAALAFPDPGQVRDALLLAVNHSGDSDSTGSICGNLTGAWHGREALPDDWLRTLEGRAAIEQVAADFAVIGWPDWRQRSDARTVTRLEAAYPPGR
jgi:ADP-ribosylglycohydrolase